MILFLGFMVCCLGVCVSLLVRKVRELESFIFTQEQRIIKIENGFKDLLDIQQRGVPVYTEAFTKLADIVSKNIIESEQHIGKLEEDFIKFRGLIYEIVYGKGEQNNGK